MKKNIKKIKLLSSLIVSGSIVGSGCALLLSNKDISNNFNNSLIQSKKLLSNQSNNLNLDKAGIDTNTYPQPFQGDFKVGVDNSILITDDSGQNVNIYCKNNDSRKLAADSDSLICAPINNDTGGVGIINVRTGKLKYKFDFLTNVSEIKYNKLYNAFLVLSQSSEPNQNYKNNDIVITRINPNNGLYVSKKLVSLDETSSETRTIDDYRIEPVYKTNDANINNYMFYCKRNNTHIVNANDPQNSFNYGTFEITRDNITELAINPQINCTISGSIFKGQYDLFTIPFQYYISAISMFAETPTANSYVAMVLNKLEPSNSTEKYVVIIQNNNVTFISNANQYGNSNIDINNSRVMELSDTESFAQKLSNNSYNLILFDNFSIRNGHQGNEWERFMTPQILVVNISNNNNQTIKQISLDAFSSNNQNNQDMDFSSNIIVNKSAYFWATYCNGEATGFVRMDLNNLEQNEIPDAFNVNKNETSFNLQNKKRVGIIKNLLPYAMTNRQYGLVSVNDRRSSSSSDLSSTLFYASKNNNNGIIALTNQGYFPFITWTKSSTTVILQNQQNILASAITKEQLLPILQNQKDAIYDCVVRYNILDKQITNVEILPTPEADKNLGKLNVNITIGGCYIKVENLPTEYKYSQSKQTKSFSFTLEGFKKITTEIKEFSLPNAQDIVSQYFCIKSQSDFPNDDWNYIQTTRANIISKLKTYIVQNQSTLVSNLAPNQTLSENDINILDSSDGFFSNKDGWLSINIQISNNKGMQNGVVVPSLTIENIKVHGFKCNSQGSKYNFDVNSPHSIEIANQVNNFTSSYNESDALNYLNSIKDTLFTNIPPSAKIIIKSGSFINNTPEAITSGQITLEMNISSWFDGDDSSILKNNTNAPNPWLPIHLTGFKSLSSDANAYTTTMKETYQLNNVSDVLPQTYNNDASIRNKVNLVIKNAIITNNPIFISNLVPNTTLTEQDIDIEIGNKAENHNNKNGILKLTVVIKNRKAWTNGNIDETKRFVVSFSGLKQQEPTIANQPLEIVVPGQSEILSTQYNETMALAFLNQSEIKQQLYTNLPQNAQIIIEPKSFNNHSYISEGKIKLQYNCSIYFESNSSEIIETPKSPIYSIFLTGFQKQNPLSDYANVIQQWIDQNHKWPSNDELATIISEYLNTKLDNLDPASIPSSGNFKPSDIHIGSINTSSNPTITINSGDISTNLQTPIIFPQASINFVRTSQKVQSITLTSNDTTINKYSANELVAIFSQDQNAAPINDLKTYLSNKLKTELLNNLPQNANITKITNISNGSDNNTISVTIKVDPCQMIDGLRAQDWTFTISGFSSTVNDTAVKYQRVGYNEPLFNQYFSNVSVYAIDWNQTLITNTIIPHLTEYINTHINDFFVNPLITKLTSGITIQADNNTNTGTVNFTFSGMSNNNYNNSINGSITINFKSLPLSTDNNPETNPLAGFQQFLQSKVDTVYEGIFPNQQELTNIIIEFLNQASIKNNLPEAYLPENGTFDSSNITLDYNAINQTTAPVVIGADIIKINAPTNISGAKPIGFPSATINLGSSKQILTTIIADSTINNFNASQIAGIGPNNENGQIIKIREFLNNKKSEIFKGLPTDASITRINSISLDQNQTTSLSITFVVDRYVENNSIINDKQCTITISNFSNATLSNTYVSIGNINVLTDTMLFNKIFNNDKGFATDWKQGDFLTNASTILKDYVNNNNMFTDPSIDPKTQVSNVSLSWVGDQTTSNVLNVEWTFNGNKNNIYNSNISQITTITLKQDPTMESLMNQFNTKLNELLKTKPNHTLSNQEIKQAWIDYLNSNKQNLPNAWIPNNGTGNFDNSNVIFDENNMIRNPGTELTTGSIVINNNAIGINTPLGNKYLPTFSLNIKTTTLKEKNYVVDNSLNNYSVAQVISNSNLVKSWIKTNLTVLFNNPNSASEITKILLTPVEGRNEINVSIDLSDCYTIDGLASMHFEFGLSGFNNNPENTTKFKYNGSTISYNSNQFNELFMNNKGYTVDWKNNITQIQDSLKQTINANPSSFFINNLSNTQVSNIDITLNEASNSATISLTFNGQQNGNISNNITNQFTVNLRPSPSSSDTNPQTNPLAGLQQFLQQKIEQNDWLFPDDTTLKNWVSEYLNNIKNQLPDACIPQPANSFNSSDVKIDQNFITKNPNGEIILKPGAISTINPSNNNLVFPSITVNVKVTPNTTLKQEYQTLDANDSNNLFYTVFINNKGFDTEWNSTTIPTLQETLKQYLNTNYNICFNNPQSNGSINSVSINQDTNNPLQYIATINYIGIGSNVPNQQLTAIINIKLKSLSDFVSSGIENAIQEKTDANNGILPNDDQIRKVVSDYLNSIKNQLPSNLIPQSGIFTPNDINVDPTKIDRNSKPYKFKPGAISTNTGISTNAMTINPKPLLKQDDNKWWIWLIIACGATILVTLIIVFITAGFENKRKNQQEEI